MITPIQLTYKINLQSKFLEKYLNLPTGFGNEPLAKAIYQTFNYDDLCSTVSDLGEKVPSSFISEYSALKFLLICEVPDENLIEELHQEIENMAFRLEKLVIINVSRIQLISLLYKLFGLEYESKYIVEADDIDLDWQPCFQTLEDNSGVLFSDFNINKTPFRLIATKLDLGEVSIEDYAEVVKKTMKQCAHVAYEDFKEHISWHINCSSIFLPFGSKNSDESPHYYKINGEQYIVYGFPLSPIMSTDSDHELEEITVLVKDTSEKQVFTLNFEYQKLTLECLLLDKKCDGDVNHSEFSQQVKNGLFDHKEACGFPLVFNKNFYYLWVRPYSNVDFLENAL